MTSKKTQTRKGASAIYVVIFTATLLSIIALSFIRLMLSESTRTTDYSLSQSAYNSALAGVEDAKIVLIKYQQCLSDGSCDAEYNDAFGSDLTDVTNSQDCDLVPRLLKYKITGDGGDNSPETMINTGGKSTDTNIRDSVKSYDQAYTCVKVSRKSKDFIATLTSSHPTKIVPLRTGKDDTATTVNRLLISWFSRDDLSNVSESGHIKSTYNYFNGSNMSGTLTDNNSFQAGTTYKNWFTSKPSVPSTLQTTLIQTAPTFSTSQFYSAGSNRTDRGTLMLRPSNSSSLKSTYGITTSNYSNHLGGTAFATNGGPFVKSATKSQNNPMDVYCNYENNIEWGNGYACVADVYVPMPLPSSATKRNDKTFFLVLNLPYGEPKTEVSVEMKHCNDNAKSVFESGNCTPVYFDGVQAVVDSTGRADDLFRRIEARVELSDSYFPIANYALAAYDPSNGNILKNFYVTKSGCKSLETKQDNSAGAAAGQTKSYELSCNPAAEY